MFDKCAHLCYAYGMGKTTRSIRLTADQWERVKQRASDLTGDRSIGYSSAAKLLVLMACRNGDHDPTMAEHPTGHPLEKSTNFGGDE